jgi:hypothetical protein
VDTVIWVANTERGMTGHVRDFHHFLA